MLLALYSSSWPDSLIACAFIMPLLYQFWSAHFYNKQTVATKMPNSFVQANRLPRTTNGSSLWYFMYGSNAVMACFLSSSDNSLVFLGPPACCLACFDMFLQEMGDFKKSIEFWALELQQMNPRSQILKI